MEQIDAPRREQEAGIPPDQKRDSEGGGGIHLWIEFGLFLSLLCALVVSIVVSFHHTLQSAGPAVTVPAVTTPVR